MIPCLSLCCAARLINSLIEYRKPYDLVLFPCERHAPHKLADRVYLEDRSVSISFTVIVLCLGTRGGGGGEGGSREGGYAGQ